MAPQASPRLTKIREMRSELKKLDFALMGLEGVFQTHGNKPVGKLQILATFPPVLSILENYILFAFMNSGEYEANFAASKFMFAIEKQMKKYSGEAGTTVIE